MRNDTHLKNYILICWFITVNIHLFSQDKEFVKKIINDQIKLDNFDLKLDKSNKVSSDSFKIVELNVNKNPIIIPTFNYGVNLLYAKDYEVFEKEDTTRKIAPAFFAPYTNSDSPDEKNNSQESRSGSGKKKKISTSMSGTSTGLDLTKLPKTYRQKKKEENLRYITTELYPVDSLKVE